MVTYRENFKKCKPPPPPSPPPSSLTVEIRGYFSLKEIKTSEIQCFHLTYLSLFCVVRWSLHCVKSLQKRSFYDPYSVQIREDTDQKNSVFGHFRRSVVVNLKIIMLIPRCSKRLKLKLLLWLLQNLFLPFQKNFTKDRWCCSSVIKQKDESQNWCYKKTKHAKFSEKRTYLTPWYAQTRVRNVRFSENLACFVFL